MGGILTKEKIKRLRRRITELRNAKHNIRPSDLVSLAESLGRKLKKGGKHPTYISYLLTDRNPISIPGHPTIKSPTAMSIVDDLESDIDRLSELLDEQERKANEQPKRLPPAPVRTDSNTR
jgi:hypothetical protein